ncbi:MAG: acetolactate synthase [Candidatus Omnitrophica bacterium CG1_02_44_16]|nr:MAG: acetolactate synthase [Candidatus Omnitrophica bacterium CG1_02_44_16]PIY83083.1 MAG: acetolactate synthase [Candidatus Omnitrophica bacterium CG_4_10_14_0_8_um_filter_44_12]PIZ83603.1 MAG: acetolactate synthase [Candidatus Omnitrophica bacterium CG_4_10_14_0_2_um_filter_44_9]
MKVSDYIIDLLARENVGCVFEVCGGAITHLLDSLYERKDIKVISMHHEQAAAMAAEGFARSHASVGVAMATSGPGATNMITGIASCYFDSIPSIFITGQVNTYEFKFNKPVRQIGFQETDITKIVKPIVKDAVLIKDPGTIRYYLERAFCIARSGRPGPVLLDIPMNIQRARINPRLSKPFSVPLKNRPSYALDKNNFAKAIDLLKTALRPIILVGGGVRLSKAENELLKLIDKTGVPVVSSLMGLDAFPHDHPAFVGFIGTYGNRYANLCLANCDLLLALGTRFDTRQTGTKPETFARAAKKIHVDIDPYELNNKIKVDIAVESDIKDFLVLLNERMGAYDKKRISVWKNIIQNNKNKYPSFGFPKGDAIAPNFLMHQLSAYLSKDAIVCVDIGQNQIWAAQSLFLSDKRRFLTQGGMGAMGSALPMGIGASFANPARQVVVITGDGGFQLNIQELQTIFHHRLPIKIILLNNSCYGMVRQFQKQYFNSRFQSTTIGYSCPDFQDVVSAYKIPCSRVSSRKEADIAFKRLFKDRKPMFLEVKIRRSVEVKPKLGVGKPIEEQEPTLPAGELESLMMIKPIRNSNGRKK